jgi:hypothetical protein
VGRRAAVITQADVARAIRAVQAAGLRIYRVIATDRGVEIVTDKDSAITGDNENHPVATKKVVIL